LYIRFFSAVVCQSDDVAEKSCCVSDFFFGLHLFLAKLSFLFLLIGCRNSLIEVSSCIICFRCAYAYKVSFPACVVGCQSVHNGVNAGNVGERGAETENLMEQSVTPCFM
jgi:hypothetical protein